MKCSWVHLALGFIAAAAQADNGRPWVRHVIDDGMAGADGVRELNAVIWYENPLK